MTQDLTIGGEFFIAPYTQICASAETEARRYHLLVGKSGRRWLVADVPNDADYVYVEGGPGSDGFAGRTLTFPLVDGGELSLRGPWHTNADALFADTGKDIRDRNLCFAVIGTGIDYRRGPSGVITGLVYFDPGPVLRKIGKIETHATELSDKLGVRLFLHETYPSGSSTTPINYHKYPAAE